MARSAATARTTATARSTATTRSAITSYRVPIEYYDLGITKLWDFRTGFDGSKSYAIANMIGKGTQFWKGTTAIATALTTGLYSCNFVRAVTDYFATNPMDLVQAQTSMTVFAWVKLAANTLTQAFITHWDTSGNQRGFMFRVNASNNIDFLLSLNGTASTTYATTSTFTDTSAWHFIVATYDTTNRGQVNLDKIPQTTTKTAGSDVASINSSPVSILLGAQTPSSPASLFGGSMGICGIAENKSMTGAEITQLYNLTNSIGKYV